VWGATVSVAGQVGEAGAAGNITPADSCMMGLNLNGHLPCRQFDVRFLEKLFGILEAIEGEAVILLRGL
jgi:hypothetical protein